MSANSPSASGSLGQQLRHQARQKERFPGEVAADRVGAAGIGPTLGESGVNGIEHRAEAAGKLLALRDAERNAGLADLFLGPHQALAHGRG